MLKRQLIFPLGLLKAGLGLFFLGLLAADFAGGAEVNPNGPYFECPLYFGFSDFSADAAKIEDKLISVIDAEVRLSRAAGLTRRDKNWPAGAVYVAAYSFTSQKLADALVHAARAGCEMKKI